MASMCFLFSKYSPNILVNENHGRLFYLSILCLNFFFFFSGFLAIAYLTTERTGADGRALTMCFEI